ncbi:hypothetical protein ABZW32_35745 [Streptomyces sp. NPDC004667]|uniref:hypothetical protein n=1 Tax=Streptomyces sp. NPDC004667 TaxID=3154285 RepID=UPI00339FF522
MGATSKPGPSGPGQVDRRGQHSTHELGIQPEAYDPHLDVDFSPLHGDGHPEAAGYGQAA